MYTYTYSRRRRQSISPLVMILPLLAIMGLAAFQLTRAVPSLQAEITVAPSSVLGQAPALNMPAAGSALVAVTGLGTLASSGPQTPRPIASVTKMMTARVILKDHPLRLGEPGPTITLTQADASRYLQMLAEDQSALPVSAGMRLTQLELLQGMLIPSANNFAEILAAWDAGSIEAFVAKMNAEARALGMNSTTFADVSGFSPRSVSTPQDLLLLERALMQDPVFAAIVGTQTLRLPAIGTVSNVNQILGVDGIVGIKTGYTEEAGGNLAFAARRQIGGTTAEILGSVLGQVDRPAAFAVTRSLVTAVGNALQTTAVARAGQVVGSVSAPWGSEADLVIDQDVEMLLWPGMDLRASVEVGQLEAPAPAGSEVGWLTLRLGEQEARVPIKLANDLEGAGLLWRLTRF